MTYVAAMTDFFVNPWLLAGMLLVAAPVILHLLNKRRFEVVDWAIMEFLFDAQTQNRRRLRLEDLLLLLLRMLGIAVLVFAFSRPLITGLAGGREDERVVVIDDSFSMEAVDGATDVLGLARGEARTLIEEAVARSIPLDVYRGSAPSGERWEGAARLGGMAFSAASAGNAEIAAAAAAARYERASGLLDRLSALEASDLPLGFSSVLNELGERPSSEEAPRARTVFVVSDLRRGDWFEEDGQTLRRDVRAVLEDLASRELLENLRLECVPVGRPNRENVAVVDVRSRTDRPLVGHPIRVVVTVKNFGARPRTGLRGWLEVGSSRPAGYDFSRGDSSRGDTSRGDSNRGDSNRGDSNRGDSSRGGGADGRNAAGRAGGGVVDQRLFVARQRVPLATIASLAAGETASAHAEFQVEESGSYPLRVQLDADLLRRDDRSYAVLDVRRGTRVLLVDGSPGSVPLTGGTSSTGGRFAGEGGFLKVALAPRGEISSGVVVREHQGPLAPEHLLETDVVLLLNHRGVTSAEREMLERFVDFGGGLGFFLGNHVRSEDYARAFRRPPSEADPGVPFPTTLFPAALRAPPARAGRPDGGLFHFTVTDWNHPAFAVFRGVEGSSLERVGFSRFFGLDPAPGTSVLARFDDDARTPAIVEVARVRDAVSAIDGDVAPVQGEGAGGAAADAGAEEGRSPGRVVIFNVTADRDWGDWPRDPSYPIAMQEWVKYLAPRTALRRAVTAGQPLLWRTHPGVRYEVVLPGGRSRALPAIREGWASFDETERAGHYCVLAAPADPRLTPPAGALEPVWFASRRVASESDLEPAAAERLATALREAGLNTVVREPASGGQTGLTAGAGGNSGGGSEMWRWCALGLGALLILELIAAWWLGRRTL